MIEALKSAVKVIFLTLSNIWHFSFHSTFFVETLDLYHTRSPKTSSIITNTMVVFFPGCFVYSGQMAWRRKSWQILDICLFVCSLSPVRKDDLDQETLSKRYFLANGPWLALLHCSSWFIGHCKWGIRIDSIATLWKYDSCCSRINQQHQRSIVN